MRNMLALVGLLVMVVAGVGLYRGWFKFNVDSDKNVTINVDGQRAIQDGKKGLDIGAEKLKGLSENLKKDGTPATPSGSPTPAVTAGPK
jgi:predicted exporter